MLLQLIINQPQAITSIFRNTPTWVWGLLTVLLALGLSQLRERRVSLLRVSLIPLGMTAFSIWGNLSAFGQSPHVAAVLGAWLATAAVVTALVAPGTPAGRYDDWTSSFLLPGSWVPLALIAGIFMTKYLIGVELALQPRHVADTGFVLPVAMVYGVFNGIFVGRAVRLWRLAFRPAAGSSNVVNA